MEEEEITRIPRAAVIAYRIARDGRFSPMGPACGSRSGPANVEKGEEQEGWTGIRRKTRCNRRSRGMGRICLGGGGGSSPPITR
ncbi:protein of unknown function [Methylacidimicrobium sp. AP8]|nr:protein of unknown function [Methylacidimicrobium sp. AP8]